MNKLIIGGVVGGILIFFWQFLSWSVLNVHGSMQQYTPKQDTVMAFLSSQFSEDGFYFMPGLPEGSSSEEYQKAMESGAGKPWAQLYYHKSMNTNMGMNMARGLLVDIVAVMLLCWILMKIPEKSLMTTLLIALSIGFISWLTTSYTSSIWFETHSIPDLIDAFLSWGLCGLWLGWWLNR